MATDEFVEAFESKSDVSQVIRTRRAFVIVDVKVIGIEQLRDDATKIIRWKIGRLCRPDVQLLEMVGSPYRARGSVMLERQPATCEEARYVIAAAIWEVFRIANNHTAEFFENAIG